MKPKHKEILSAFSVFKRTPGFRENKRQKLRKKKSLPLNQLSCILPGGSSTKRSRSLVDIASTSDSSPRAAHESPGSSGSSPGPSQREPAPKKSTPDTIKRRLRTSSAILEVPCGNKLADNVFKWLITPVVPDEFFKHIWEKQPFHIKRNATQYRGLFSCSEFSRILERETLEFKTDIDVVKYEDGNKIIQDYDGRAYAPLVWNAFETGYSIRMLNPQRYCRPIWKLCSLLQEYFSSFTNANVYLTPAASQGFAPHFDNIEAFVLQVEGRKMWKIYRPRKDNDVLARFSSGDFDSDEIGEPVMEVEMQPGDLLYFPRGYIHQAKTPTSDHSLHITVSTCMLNTYGDLLKKILNGAIDDALENDVDYRKSLPKDYLNSTAPVRDEVFGKITSLASNIFNHMNIDHGINLMAKEFLHSSLPPCFENREKSCSIHGNGEKWINGKVGNAVKIDTTTEIRWIRKRAVRLIREGHLPMLYHSFENDREYRKKNALYVALDWETTPAIEQLFETHPKYVMISHLKLPSDDERLALASLLYDKGLIESKVPLVPSDDESDKE